MADELRIANPVPAGLAAFGLSDFALSLLQANIFPAVNIGIMIPIAVFFGGIAEVIVGWLAYRRDDLFGGTVFTSYGMLWLSLGFTLLMSMLDPKLLGPGSMQIYLISWTIFTVYIWIAGLKTTKLIAFLLTLLLIELILLTIGAFGNASITIFGGYVGLVTALLAWYISAAGVINTTWGRTVLPG